MANYRARVDRLEEQIAPEERLSVLIMRDGQTQADVLAACAKDRGVKPSEIPAPQGTRKEEGAGLTTPTIRRPVESW